MKIKNIISTLCVSAAVLISSVSVYAKDVEMDADAYQPDEICGYINLKPSTDADVYLKVYRHTPETVEEGYLVYDTVIAADTVHISNNYVYGLEYNDYNIDKGTYDGYYDIFVGVHRHVDSNEEEDIAYNKLILTVEDINFTGYETFCNINVTVVEEELEEPLCVASGEKPNKTYDMTFSYVEIVEPEYVQGDANNDGKLNVRDAAFIASNLAQGKAEELPVHSDINADEKVNVRDAAFIASYLAGSATLPDTSDPTEPSSEVTEPTEEITDTTETTDVTEATDPTETTAVTDVVETTNSDVITETTDSTVSTDNTEVTAITEITDVTETE